MNNKMSMFKTIKKIFINIPKLNFIYIFWMFICDYINFFDLVLTKRLFEIWTSYVYFDFHKVRFTIEKCK